MDRTDYLLVCLAEEASEVVHATTKCLRFGLDHRWPNGKTTLAHLAEELGDVVLLVDRLVALGVDLRPPAGFAAAKQEKFDRMHALAVERGRVEASP